MRPRRTVAGTLLLSCSFIFCALLPLVVADKPVPYSECYIYDNGPIFPVGISENVNGAAKDVQVQWFLSSKFLIRSQTTWSRKNITCYEIPIDYTKVPAFTVGMPIGPTLTTSGSYNPSMLIIPQLVPTQLQMWGVDYAFSNSWVLMKTVNLTNTLSKWVGLAVDNQVFSLSKRLYVYSASRLLELDIENWTGVLSDWNLDVISGDFLPFPMTQVTSVSTALNSVYVSRTGSDLSQPGEILMFDSSTTPMSFYQILNIPKAPLMLFTWTQSTAVGLYWSSRSINPSTPTINDLWYWDLSAHAGFYPSPLSWTGSCFDMTPAIGTQRFGAYALATFSPCGNREGAASAYVEIRAQGKLRTVSGSIMSLNTGFPSAAVDVLASPSAVVLATNNKSQRRNALRLIKYGSYSSEKTIETVMQKQKPAQFELATIPPFCVSANCGPDSQQMRCNTPGRCLFYSGTSSWLCCTKSPYV